MYLGNKKTVLESREELMLEKVKQFSIMRQSYV